MATDLFTAAATALLFRRDDDEDSIPAPECESDNAYDGRLGVRISAIFVILIGSLIGAAFPVWSKRHAGSYVPSWAFFIAKYFGSGVIIATAFIHLLAPANEALGSECLTGVITLYPWPEGIALITLFAMFFAELMALRYANFGGAGGQALAGNGHSHGASSSATRYQDRPTDTSNDLEASSKRDHDLAAPGTGGHVPADSAALIEPAGTPLAESYAAQMTAIFVLEFGIVFHSVFVGLTLAVSGDEFITLYIVLVFHQTFEGLGLGTRLAEAPWPKSRRWTPYALAIGYALSTPIAIAIGLGVRTTYAPGSRTALLVNGVFDSISAGILIYTGLVELMAHEFMFSPRMQKAPVKEVITAFVVMTLGAGLMALLGYWA